MQKRMSESLLKLESTLYKRLQIDRISIPQLRTDYRLTKKEATQLVSDLRMKYTLKTDEQGRFYLARPNPSYEKSRNISLEKDEPIGIVGDTHYGSKYCDEGAVSEFYDIMEQRGVKKAFHVGDLTDGYMVYKGQIEDLIVWGFNDQRDYVAKKYPSKPGIRTYVITGNNDDNTQRVGGANIVEEIVKKRPDMSYEGIRYARFILNNGPKLDVAHHEKRRAYALSYPMQTRQRDIPPEYRSDISVFGHRHVVMYMYYNGEHMFEAGAFKHLSPYEMGNHISAVIASWILTPRIEDKKITKLVPELYMFNK